MKRPGVSGIPDTRGRCATRSGGRPRHGPAAARGHRIL